jgi:hypothetical protein
MWRARGMVIERSIDGGATWREEFTAPQAILAGVALGADAAWMTGRQGLVLKRTSAGWAVMPPPAAADVIAIELDPAGMPIITIRDGRRFRSLTEGKSWQPAD